ncbi:MAG: hypothetical protein KKD99_01005 [Proteobacteria bacterium]|nr:hypothetical protein [Pseudomonadota bacterium]MBU4447132.1 hypothetical protein [Pseudomonadota bacterium]MCG2773806.1 hypothetical protein [Desulfobacterales bacterium]
MKCPACSRQRGIKEVKPMAWVYECPRCGAIFNDRPYLYLGESYQYVLPYWAKEDVPVEQLRYYDFTCLASGNKIVRRHAWYDPETKLIHQTG